MINIKCLISTKQSTNVQKKRNKVYQCSEKSINELNFYFTLIVTFLTNGINNYYTACLSYTKASRIIDEISIRIIDESRIIGFISSRIIDEISIRMMHN